MNKKTLKKVLDKKHNEFVASIEDEEVRKLVDKNSIITGGAIASGLLNEDINDFDYYFTDKETCIAVAKYYVSRFLKNNPDAKISPVIKVDDEGRVKISIPSKGVSEEGGNDFEADPLEMDAEQTVSELDELSFDLLEDESKEKYRPVFLTSNAITLSDKIQLVIRFYGEAEEIHKNYDFVHCTNYWLSSDKSIHLNQPALESLLSKHLRYVGSLYPVSSVIRTRKFIKRGWHINAGQYIKMIFQVSQLDLTSIEVLEDQLVGVDCVYFSQVIDALKAKQKNDPKFEIDSAYLVTIIDKIF